MAKTYEVLVEGWLDGKFRKAGDILVKEPDEAKWLVLGGQLKEKTAAPVAAKAKVEAPPKELAPADPAAAAGAGKGKKS